MAAKMGVEAEVPAKKRDMRNKKREKEDSLLDPSEMEQYSHKGDIERERYSPSQQEFSFNCMECIEEQ